VPGLHHWPNWEQRSVDRWGAPLLELGADMDPKGSLEPAAFRPPTLCIAEASAILDTSVAEAFIATPLRFILNRTGGSFRSPAGFVKVRTKHYGTSPPSPATHAWGRRPGLMPPGAHSGTSEGDGVCVSLRASGAGAGAGRIPYSHGECAAESVDRPHRENVTGIVLWNSFSVCTGGTGT